MNTFNQSMKKLCALVLSVLPAVAFAYPLDGAERIGIKRLIGYSDVQKSGKGPQLPAGALLSTEQIQLHLVGKEFELTDKNRNEKLQQALDSIFATRDPSYSVMLVDYSDVQNIAWAGRNVDNAQNVGSVGKVLTMLGFFDVLAEVYPETDKRLKILSETQARAREWVIHDEHRVPKYNSELKVNQFSVLNPNDVFVLSEWLDHMVSASANGAGSVVWREAMLMQHFAKAYPVTEELAQKYFKETPKKALGDQAFDIIHTPLREANIDLQYIQQGSFWTRTGKNIIPGRQSYASTRTLANFLLRMEQGRLVDSWSSLEMKRLMYMTKRRYRYVYAPELHNSAVFFKSGSLYQCQPEEGYRCAKYMGNKRNMMNSIVIVESLPGAEPSYRYLVALISNVLKVNSAWDHSRLAAAIHEAVLTRGKVAVKDEGSAEQMKKSGESD